MNKTINPNVLEDFKRFCELWYTIKQKINDDKKNSTIDTTEISVAIYGTACDLTYYFNLPKEKMNELYDYKKLFFS